LPKRGNDVVKPGAGKDPSSIMTGEAGRGTLACSENGKEDGQETDIKMGRDRLGQFEKKGGE